MNDDQTIFALASASGKAGVAVFRISGRNAQHAIANLCEPGNTPEPRKASLRTIKHPRTNEPIDRGLLLFFATPHSFTGEDCVEFHTHGGRAVINAITDALQALPGFRIAEPGEFTRRSFENGKMDLTEAEAIADLVHAETEAQRKQALRQLGGALSKLYEDWRTRLSRSLAYMEAAIDFSDEELPADMVERQIATLRILREEIAAHLNDKNRGERMREGFSIAIIGAPNAGKSSLLNALAKREAAIVSPQAGTTRDVIEVHLDIGGYAVALADTAGLRESTDAIESEGIRRARRRADQADLKILVLDSTAPTVDGSIHALIDADTILVLNKSDLSNKKSLPETPCPFPISALNGTGIDELLQQISHEITKRFDVYPAPPLTRARHRAALEVCIGHIDRALEATMPDMRAEDVRMAMRSLGQITGRVDVEELLDIIFRDFCIGK